MPTVVCHALMRCPESSASISDKVPKKPVPPQTASVIELPPELPLKTKRSRMCILHMYCKHCYVLSYFIQWCFFLVAVSVFVMSSDILEINILKKILLNMIFNNTYLYLVIFAPCYFHLSSSTLANSFSPS